MSHMSRVAAEVCDEAMSLRFPHRKDALHALELGKERTLHEALLARDHASLAMPVSSTFEPLATVGSEVSLANCADREMYASHTVYRLPCDSMTPAGADPRMAMEDVIHRFKLQPSVSAPLNEGLHAWAELREGLALAERERADPVVAGPGSHAGLRLSNIGGFASWQDVFEPMDDDDTGDSTNSAYRSGDEQNGVRAAEREGRRHAHKLQKIVSTAVDVAAHFDAAESESSTSAAPGPPDGLPAAEYRAQRRAEGPGTLHAATAWLNVNRAADYNELHVHPAHLWSAVYYVAEGDVAEGDARSAACSSPSPTAGSAGGQCADALRMASSELAAEPGTDVHAKPQVAGRMIFRTGCVHVHPTDGASTLDRPFGSCCSAPATAPDVFSYFTVLVEPGTLWLFPGRMPHLVMGGQQSAVPRMSRRCRVSVAVNFTHAQPPPSTPARLPPCAALPVAALDAQPDAQLDAQQVPAARHVQPGLGGAELRSDGSRLSLRARVAQKRQAARGVRLTAGRTSPHRGDDLDLDLAVEPRETGVPPSLPLSLD